jgi:HTH-type transcriptional regulator / antitoxin MqsA
MKCSIQGCPGSYRQTTISRTLTHKGRPVIIDHVPAEVCDTCGDVLLTAQTAEHIERLLQSRPQPTATAPVYEYAA